MLTKIQKKEIVKEIGRDEKNTGLTEVQIALLTKEIKLLTDHFAKHKKDNHSKRGLFKKISKRNALLKYLKQKDYDRYLDIVNELKIRGVK